MVEATILCFVDVDTRGDESVVVEVGVGEVFVVFVCVSSGDLLSFGVDDGEYHRHNEELGMIAVRRKESDIRKFPRKIRDVPRTRR